MKIKSLLLLLTLMAINLSANDNYTYSLDSNIETSIEQFINNNHYFAAPEKDLFKVKIKTIKYRYIEEIDSNFKKNDELWSDNGDLVIHHQGIKRHLDLMRISFPIFKSSANGDSVLVYCNYSIDYGMQLPKKDTKIDKYVVSAFGSIANLDDLPKILTYIHSKKQNKTLSSSNWIDPNLEYIKITTKEDGVAFLEMSKLLNMMPNWSGKSTEELQLLYKGTKYPVYFSSSSLNQSTKMFFKSQRAKGDTTWFDNYAGEEPYFLVRNPADKPIGLKALNTSSNPSLILDRVNINRHIEEEHEYSYGDTVYSHTTLPFEGWYWNVFDKYEKPRSLDLKRFTADIAMSTSDDPIDLQLRYNTQLNYDHSRSDFGIVMRINGRVHDSAYVKALGEGFLKNDKSIKIHPGAASFEVIAHGFKDDVGRVGIDYLLLSGKAKPFALDGKIDFDISAQSQDFKVSVPGFSSPEVIAFDTISNSYSFLNAKQGTSFRANVINEETKYASIIINDSLYVSKEAGIHIASVDESGKWRTAFFTPGNDNAVAEINALKNRSFTICINKFPVSGSIKSALESLSASSVPGSQGSTYIIYGKNGVQTKEVSNSGEIGIAEFLEHQKGYSYQAELNLKANKDYSLLLVDANHYDIPNMYRVENIDIMAKNEDYNAIVLTHNELLPSAIAYKQYRASRNIFTKVVDVNNIYDRYNYGKKSPHAIKDYLKDIYNNWTGNLPTHIVIIGDASWDNREIMKLGKTRDFVPTYGWPATDYWFTLMDGPTDLIGEFAIGRIPVNNNEQMISYIDKIKSYETAPKSTWMKRSLHLSGGDDKAQIAGIYKKSKLHATLLSQKPICADTIHVIKPSGDVVSEAVASKIKNEINNGVNLVTFFGHGSPQVFDIEGWQVEKLNNKDRYFGLLTLACNSGAFAEPDFENCRNESYVVAPNRGAIVAVGGTGIEEENQVHSWAQYYWEGIIMTELNIRTYGDMVLYPKSTLPLIKYYTSMRFQTNLLGDPLVELRIGNTPDPYLNHNFVSLLNEKGSAEFTDENHNLNIRGNLHNYGIAYLDTVLLRLTYTYNGVETTQDILYNQLLNSEEFSFSIPINSKPGKYNISLQIDPEGTIEKDDVSNNTLSFDIDVFKRGLLPLEPLAYWNVNHSNPKFRFINPLEGDFSYKFIITDKRGDTLNTVYESSSEEIISRENFILWNSFASLVIGKNYWVGAKPFSSNGSVSEIDWLWIPFHASGMQPDLAEYVKNEGNLAAHSFESAHVIDSDDKEQIVLDDKDYEYYLVSIKGKDVDGENTRWATLTVADQTFIDIWSARGFNVVTYPKFQNEGQPRYKRFDCYRENIHTDKNLNYVYELHSFLRDSVKENEYVAIVTCDNSLSWQEYIQQTNPEDSGSLDTLKKLLRMYGATKVDSLHSQTSYALFSWKGANSNEAREAINMEKDTALVSGTFTLYQNNGSAGSDIIGPAQEWKSLELEGKDFDHSNIEVYLHDTLNAKTLYGEFSPDNKIDLTEVDAAMYPFVSYKVNLERENLSQRPEISEIELQYKPSPELALKESSFVLDKEKVLRGEKNGAQIIVENISGRSSVNKANVSLSIYKNQSLAEQKNIEINNMSVDQSQKVKIDFETFGLSENNEVKINANPYKNYFTELYSFNNTYSQEFELEEDSIRPSAIILSDNSVIGNHSYVAASPLLEVRVYDNSPLDFIEGIEPAVRLNGKYYTEDNAQYYNLEFYQDSEDSLKAILQVRPDTIKFEESLLITYLMDATGNRDTVEYYLNTTNKSKIEAVNASPNPFSNETTLEFNLVASSAEGSVDIFIFNSEGQKVKGFVLENLRVGKNSIKWDGTDENGLDLPSGAYYFSVVRKSDIYTEESYGKVIIIR